MEILKAEVELVWNLFDTSDLGFIAQPRNQAQTISAR
jgi:hypothetical protein